MQQFFVAGNLSPTNVRLLHALRDCDLDAVLLPIDDVLRHARPADVVLGRLDVRSSLDGIDRGLEQLEQLEQHGVHVLNRPPALFAAHDKLLTAIRLREAQLPHPRTSLVDEHPRQPVETPVVVKPRFGSWGRDIFLCEDERSLRRTLRRLRNRPWFRRQGALLQELVPPQHEDLRVIVAGGDVVGAVKRVAPAGEWRTNVALGAHRLPVTPLPEARALALAAADVIDADFVGVDLLPSTEGFVIIEVNGCVDLTDAYSLGSTSVFDEIAARLVASAEAALTITRRADALTRPLSYELTSDSHLAPAGMVSRPGPSSSPGRSEEATL
jgi:RimK family alpha-L-glutamate ligase